MEKLIQQHRSTIVAIGECGLDYDRLHFSPKKDQLAAFPIHFRWAKKYDLPLYLHSRNCAEDFMTILKQNINQSGSIRGVVHSFTGTKSEMRDIIDLGLFIGLNGCSLRTKENIEVVREIPLDRILLETDAPYCSISKTSAGYGFIKEQLPFRRVH